MPAAAACYADLHEFSRPGGAYQPVGGLVHFLVHGALNSKKIQYRRGEFRARYVGVKFHKSRGLRTPKFGSSFTVQPERYKLFSSRTRSSDRLGNANIAERRILEPLAAVATGPGNWEARLEDSQESPAEFWRIWNFKTRSSGERLAFLGILALTGLVVVRVLRGSSLVSVGAIIVLLFFGAFHHRLNPGLVFLGEKLQQLKRTFISSAQIMSISFQQQNPGATPDSLLYSLSGSSHLIGGQVPSAADGISERGKLVDVKDVATCVNLLTSIIQNLDTNVIAEDVLSVNNLMNLQLGITKLREDLYRAVSALQVKEILLQAKLQSIPGFGSQSIEENTSDTTVVQVPPGNKVVNNFELTSDHSDRMKSLSSSSWSVSGGLEMKLNEEDGKVVNWDSSSFSDSQQGPQSSSNHVPARGKNFQAQSYQVITADYKLEPVTRFTRMGIGFKTRAISDSLLSEVGTLEGDDERYRLKAATQALQNPTYVSKQIITDPLAAMDTPHMSKQSGWSHGDGIETKTALSQEGQRTTIEKEFTSSLEPRSVNKKVHEEPALAYNRNREDEQPVIVTGRDSTDSWRDDRDDDSPASSSLVKYENDDFHRETLVMQNTITPSPSGRRTDYDNDSAPYIRSIRKGVVYSDDFRGIETTTAARVGLGTLSGTKVTRRGSLHGVNNKLPEKRNWGWTDEEMSQGSVPRRDSAEGDGQPTTAGQDYVQGEPELWDNEFVIDEDVSNRQSTRGSHNYQPSERDLVVRKISAGDREWSYGGRGPQNRNITGEEGDYRNVRSPDSRHYSHGRTRSYNAQGDTQILNKGEEEEFFSKREARDIEEEYYANESRTWVPDDVGASQNGRELEGNYKSHVRMKSRSKVRNHSRNRIPRVEEDYEVDDAEDDDRYGRESRNLGVEGQEYGSGRMSRAKSQYPGKEMQRVSDYHSEPERSTDLPPYVRSGIEPEERNLPVVRQPNRMQLEKFDKMLDEGEALLEEGMQGLEGRIEVGVAERMLYEAVNLFEAAAEIDPSSLIAVGFWGNTLLVHGELKLKLSQQLRTMLPTPDSYSMTRARAGTGRDDQRESLELALQNVSEECEELLVDAGRKYRMALSLDRTDMRALYNWGLALCYRAQLIADEGGERAIQDADKVYLAAIDKFEAILGMNQEYAAGALYNWGLAMRDRARLRPVGERDRVKLLIEAKELFQDSVRLDPTNGQARGAITAAVAELEELKRFEEMQSKQGISGRSPRSWLE